MDRQFYADRLQKLEQSYLKSKQDLLAEYLAVNRKYPDRMTFSYYEEIATITGAIACGLDIKYFCYVPSICDGFPILGEDEPLGDRPDSGVLLAEKIIDRALKNSSGKGRT